jgi:hypothetical protein
LVLDVHTRMVAGLTLSLDPPSAAGTALALTQAVLPKAGWLTDRAIGLAWPMQGLPELIHVDNGAEFHSRTFERGCQQHGIRIEYRPPATPRFGGHIERLMGTLMGRIHGLPGTTFSSVAARGDYASEARAVLSFRDFERILVLEATAGAATCRTAPGVGGAARPHRGGRRAGDRTADLSALSRGAPDLHSHFRTGAGLGTLIRNPSVHRRPVLPRVLRHATEHRCPQFSQWPSQ